MQYIKFHLSFDQGWLTTIRSIMLDLLYGLINLEFDFPFCKWATLKFFGSTCFLKFSTYYQLSSLNILAITKDVRGLKLVSHGVMRFWLLLNFLFISAFFDILASLSISRVFISVISGRWKSSCSDIPRAIIPFDYIN